MDPFEQELARLLRDGRHDTPYDGSRRHSLRARVEARRRARRARLAVGSALTLTGLALGVMALAGPLTEGGPGAPAPRPSVSSPSVPGPVAPRPVSGAHAVPGPPVGVPHPPPPDPSRS